RIRHCRMRPSSLADRLLPGHLQAGAATDAALAATSTVRLLLDGEADTAAQGPALARTKEVVAEHAHCREAECHVVFPKCDVTRQTKALARNEVRVFKSHRDCDAAAKLADLVEEETAIGCQIAINIGSHNLERSLLSSSAIPRSDARHRVGI